MIIPLGDDLGAGVIVQHHPYAGIEVVLIGIAHVGIAGERLAEGGIQAEKLDEIQPERIELIADIVPGDAGVTVVHRHQVAGVFRPVLVVEGEV